MLAAVAAASDLRVFGFQIPYHCRQVNELWLNRYRPWVYGAGFGWQVGVGIATFIMTAGVFLMIALAVLTTSPLAALGIGMVFGIVRGLAVVPARRITTPEALRDFHQRFDALGPVTRRLMVVIELAVAATAAVAAWGVVIVGVLALGVAAIVLVAAAAGRHPVACRRGRGFRGGRFNALTRHARTSRRYSDRMTSSGTDAHRITVSEPVVAVRVDVDGVVVAETTRARVLREGGLPPRYYVPRDDVRMELLVSTEHSTTCPFKGDASYWTLELDDTRHENIVWSYEEPIESLPEIAGAPVLLQRTGRARRRRRARVEPSHQQGGP